MVLVQDYREEEPKGEQQVNLSQTYSSCHISLSRTLVVAEVVNSRGLSLLRCD